MKNIVINKTMNFITKYNQYDDVKLEELKYGLASIYITLSKLIVILFIAILLNIFKELIILLLIYNILRSVSFGLHATKSWICLLMSTIIFIGGTILCINFVPTKSIICIISLITIPMIYTFSPADTKKRPIINKKRRKTYQYLSTVIATLYYILSLVITNNFIINCLMLSLIIQSVMINPLVYKLFKLPYANYKNYIMD